MEIYFHYIHTRIFHQTSQQIVKQHYNPTWYVTAISSSLKFQFLFSCVQKETSNTKNVSALSENISRVSYRFFCSYFKNCNPFPIRMLRVCIQQVLVAWKICSSFKTSNIHEFFQIWNLTPFGALLLFCVKFFLIYQVFKELY